jgi:hypothetical protein
LIMRHIFSEVEGYSWALVPSELAGGRCLQAIGKNTHLSLDEKLFALAHK